MAFYIHIVFFIILQYYYISKAAEAACGDWEPYKDEKCYKIFDQLALETYADAVNTCHQQNNDSSLITIHTPDEQLFISNFLQSKKTVDNVWIGAKFTSNKYKWLDDTELIYSNWAVGYPKNQTDNCVQLLSDETSFGKWSDVLCSKKNLVVCEKMQTLTLSQLQKVVFQAVKNPFPVGFIYVQLPNEKSPKEIWSWMVWSDVSVAYEGLFFRVEGGNSASFGSIQDADTIRIKNYYWRYYQSISSTTNYYYKNSVPKHGNSSGIASYTLSDLVLESDGPPDDVRPRNTAIRIWKRIS